MTKIIAMLLITISPFFIISCGSKKLPRGLTDKQLYEVAIEEMESADRGFLWIFSARDYDRIFELLKEVQLRYTYSPYAVLAELRTADAYFEKGEYEEASVGYEEFIERHPRHKEVGYATYRLALSYFERLSNAEKDPTSARTAIKWFNEFISKHPDSSLIAEAQKKIAKCRDRLAKREIYIGNFYSKRKNYRAAASRYSVVVTNYKDTKRLEEALYLLGEAYVKQNEFDLARKALSQLIQEYPSAKYSNKASKLLNNIRNKSANPLS